MNNFRKDFIAKKGSCFKMELRSPLGKVEGGEDEEEPKPKKSKDKPFKENKKNKSKSNVDFKETPNDDGTKTVETTTYRKRGKHAGEVKLETKTDFKDGVSTGSQQVVKTKKSGEKKVKVATGKYKVKD